MIQTSGADPAFMAPTNWIDGVIWQSLIAPDRPEEEIAQRITDTAIRMLLAEPERLEEYLA